ncbi:pyruvate kinase, partial [Salmonella enterica]|uniref:pyruvate kinase n=1 Tax=Salmonella enterica TaxID=28901 RepID=UPI000CC23977
MDVARINLAHDNENAWKNMIQNIRKAEENTSSEVQIMMDISGPKIRTDWIFTYLKKPKVVAGDYIRITKDYDNLPKEDFVKVTAGCNLP